MSSRASRTRTGRVREVPETVFDRTDDAGTEYRPGRRATGSRRRPSSARLVRVVIKAERVAACQGDRALPRPVAKRPLTQALRVLRSTGSPDHQSGCREWSSRRQPMWWSLTTVCLRGLRRKAIAYRGLVTELPSVWPTLAAAVSSDLLTVSFVQDGPAVFGPVEQAAGVPQLPRRISAGSLRAGTPAADPRSTGGSWGAHSDQLRLVGRAKSQ
jgi:hypothetical protein